MVQMEWHKVKRVDGAYGLASWQQLMVQMDWQIWQQLMVQMDWHKVKTVDGANGLA